MTVEKAQVTFALQASSLTGPLGRHVCSCFIDSKAATQTLVIVAHDLGADREVRRIMFAAGALSAHEADVASATLGDYLYEYILRYIGIQPLLPVPSGEGSDLP